MKQMPRRIATTATEALRQLWAVGFFKTAHTLADIDERLGKDDYHFGLASLAKALERASYLTRKGARGSYTYIQKHPYVEDEEK